jgi:hypothetical protein
VLGDAALVTQVREQVETLSAIVLRPLQIEVCLWQAGTDEAPPALLRPDDWKRFVGDREPLWRCTAETQGARPVALEQQRWTRYVRDVDCEVAQKQSVSVPVTDAFGDGGRVVVTPHTLVGGDDLVLHVQFGIAHRRGVVRTLPTGVPGQADLELPLLETIYGACSGRITNGGALAVTLRGAPASGGQYVLTVRVTSRTPPTAPTLGGLVVLPCSALTSHALSQRLAPPPPSPDENDQSPASPNTEEIGAGFGHIEGDVLQDLLRTSLGDQGENCELFLAGGHLFVLAAEPVRTKVEAVLLGLQERMLRTVTVRHRGRLVGTDAAATSVHEIVLPTLLGRETTVGRVLESNVIRDLYLEIAQEASVHDPQVACLQVGSWLRVRAAPEGARLHVQMLAQCTQAPPPQLRSVVPSGGNLMPTDVASVRVQHDGPAANGQALEHGDGPTVVLDGRPMRSTLDTTFSW